LKDYFVMDFAKMLFRRSMRKVVSGLRSSRLRTWLASFGGYEESPSAYRSMGSFEAKDGSVFTLYEGYRDAICPDWRMMFSDPGLYRYEQLLQKTSKAKEDISSMEQLLSVFGFSLWGKEIVEIGCYDGLRCNLLAKRFQAKAIGTDMAQYYLLQTDALPIDALRIERQNAVLSRIRKEVTSRLGEEAFCLKDNQVAFLEDDISGSLLPTSSVDCILSWEVLEHIANPQRGFREMFRILRPGGFTFHEYNPFFCPGGGHSLCTLDFPFGHVRLSQEDFTMYVETVRPSEAKVARQFYENNLNRMTLMDLGKQAEAAGFTVLAIIPWIAKRNLATVTRDILTQARKNYTTVSLNDLVCNQVWILMQKNL